jgi:polysaccharide biosynthesis transport protein
VEHEKVFSLGDYLAVLRRQRVTIVVIAFAAAALGVLWFLLQTPLYQAETELTLQPVRVTEDISLFDLLNPLGEPVGATEVQTATSREVAERATEALGRDDPAALQGRVSASADTEVPILRIRALDPDPATAAAIADAFAQAFLDHRRDETVETVRVSVAELETRETTLRASIEEVDAELRELGVDPEPPTEVDPESGLVIETPGPQLSGQDAAAAEVLFARRESLQTLVGRVVARSTELNESVDALTGFGTEFTPAIEPSRPTGSDLPTVALISFVLGLALGIAFAFVRDHFDDILRDEDDLKRATDRRPVLGRIPVWKPSGDATERLASIVEPTSSVAEAYRELSAGVRFLLVARRDEPQRSAGEHHGLSRSRSVMVCSAMMGEGKSSTAANLAVAAARVGLRTALVDADLRRPTIARRFGLGRVTGLSDALLDGAPPEDHMLDVGIENLSVLASGTLPPNPTELLASPAMRAMQLQLLERYDLVVIDTPAVLAVPDALEIGPYVDLAIMVGRVGSTSRRRLGAGIERLAQVGTVVSGTVLNGIDRATDPYYYAYYYREDPAADLDPASRSQRRAARKAAAKGRGEEPPAAKGRDEEPPAAKQQGEAPIAPQAGHEPITPARVAEQPGAQEQVTEEHPVQPAAEPATQRSGGRTPADERRRARGARRAAKRRRRAARAAAASARSAALLSVPPPDHPNATSNER